MLIREGTSRVAVGRDEFLRRTWEWKEEFGGKITQQLRRLGASCDWSREHFTLDPCVFPRSTGRLQKTLRRWLDLPWYALGELVTKPTNRRIRPGSRIRRARCQYVAHPLSNYRKSERRRMGQWRMAANAQTYITVATTRPETLMGDVAVGHQSR
jgi:valyl-tRNA synthetase